MSVFIVSSNFQFPFDQIPPENVVIETQILYRDDNQDKETILKFQEDEQKFYYPKSLSKIY